AVRQSFEDRRDLRRLERGVDLVHHPSRPDSCRRRAARRLFWPTGNSLSIQAIIAHGSGVPRTSRTRRALADSWRATVRLELGAPAEAELLHDVVALFGERDRVVEPQRAERRIPDESGADRGAEVKGSRVGELNRLPEELREHGRPS